MAENRRFWRRRVPPELSYPVAAADCHEERRASDILHVLLVLEGLTLGFCKVIVFHRLAEFSPTSLFSLSGIQLTDLCLTASHLMKYSDMSSAAVRHHTSYPSGYPRNCCTCCLKNTGETFIQLVGKFLQLARLVDQCQLLGQTTSISALAGILDLRPQPRYCATSSSPPDLGSRCHRSSYARSDRSNGQSVPVEKPPQ